MDICSSGHEEIVYSSRYCPLCELIEKFQMEIDELNNRIDGMVEWKQKEAMR